MGVHIPNGYSTRTSDPRWASQMGVHISDGYHGWELAFHVNLRLV